MKDTQFGRFSSERTETVNISEADKKECVDFLRYLKTQPADYASYRIREALTTSDFPTLFGKVVEDILISNYTNSQPIWNQIAALRVVRQPGVNADQRDFLADVNIEQIPEGGQYPVGDATTDSWSIQINKYGGRFNLTLETILRDVFNALDDVAPRLAYKMRAHEETLVLSQIFGAGGLNSTTFDGTNTLASNPVLSRENLNAAIEQLVVQNDRNSDPIDLSAMNLIVPRHLEQTAREILETREYTIIDGSGNEAKIVGNGVSSTLTLVVSPYNHKVITNARRLASTWVVTAAPTNGRAPVYAGKLFGQENPVVLQENSRGLTPSGGLDIVSFDNDTTAYKVRGFFGAAAPYKNLMVGSNGSGF